MAKFGNSENFLNCQDKHKQQQKNPSYSQMKEEKPFYNIIQEVKNLQYKHKVHANKPEEEQQSSACPEVFHHWQ